MDVLIPDIITRLPIGHVTVAMLRATCRHARAVLGAFESPPDATAWAADFDPVTARCGGVDVKKVTTKHRRARPREPPPHALVMTLRCYSQTITRQITRCRHVRYGAVHAVALGNECPKIRRCLLEIFGASLSAAPMFFTHAGGGIRSRAPPLVQYRWNPAHLGPLSNWTAPPPPLACVRLINPNAFRRARVVRWGTRDEVMEYLEKKTCVFVHVCAR